MFTLDEIERGQDDLKRSEDRAGGFPAGLTFGPDADVMLLERGEC